MQTVEVVPLCRFACQGESSSETCSDPELEEAPHPSSSKGGKDAALALWVSSHQAPHVCSSGLTVVPPLCRTWATATPRGAPGESWSALGLSESSPSHSTLEASPCLPWQHNVWAQRTGQWLQPVGWPS